MPVIPGWMIVLLGITLLTVLFFLYRKHKEYLALALYLPTAYFTVSYSFVDVITVEAARFYVRSGIVLLLVCLIVATLKLLFRKT